MRLPVIEVQVKRARILEQSVGLNESRLQELPVVREVVVVAVQGALDGVVRLPLKTHA